jgi:hypothetical protein
MGDQVKAWVVSADMGLGHQRAIYPLTEIAHENIITVGLDKDSPKSEQKLWKQMLGSYEFISRAKQIPLIGKLVFKPLDALLHIPPMYPLRDFSNPSFQVKLLKKYIKKGLCRGMLDKVKTAPMPIVSSFYAPSIAADYENMSRNYCIITDTDLNRVWVTDNPRESKIHYFAPCGRAVTRLKIYGIPDERIFLTGFPLPIECLGDDTLDVLKQDLGQRLHYLDPNNRFWPLHGRNAEHFLGKGNCKMKNERILTITYAVGGAGAQKEIGKEIATSLKDYILNGKIKLNLVAGIRSEVREYFQEVKSELVKDHPGIEVIHAPTKNEYFHLFSMAMKTTDILWTKPSELSFYTGLGIPLIMAPPVGSQEDHNRKWLLEIQAGIDQKDPRYAHQWLINLLENGRLAESAWDGFLKARKFGTYKIREVLETGTMKRETSPLFR